MAKCHSSEMLWSDKIYFAAFRHGKPNTKKTMQSLQF